jgi:hypothetical protein
LSLSSLAAFLKSDVFVAFLPVSTLLSNWFMM